MDSTAHSAALGLSTRIKQHFLALVYPLTCVFCGAPGADNLDLCAACYADLSFNHHPCSRCAVPLPNDVPAGQLCAICQSQPPVFDRCVAPFIYGGLITRLIVGLKFNQRLAHANLLSQLLLKSLCNKPEIANAPPELIIPVPLHPSRLRSRGFNQTVEIARPLARHFGIPLDTRHCRRIRLTPTQIGLNAIEREHNLRGAFIAPGNFPARVALLDDVVTTGATANELSRVLKASGVQSVEVWTMARTDWIVDPTMPMF